MKSKLQQSWFSYLVWSCFLLILLSAPSLCQENETSEQLDQSIASEQDSDERNLLPKEVKPSIYYLKNEHGKLVPMPNFTLKDFIRIWKLEQSLTQLPSRHAIQQLSITGEAKGDFAELNVQVKIQTHDDRWVRVPLQLNHALLREPIQYSGPSRQLVQFEGDGEGFVSWIQGVADEQHTLLLKLLVPLSKIGEQSRLRLKLPLSPHSQFSFSVPGAEIVGTASDNTNLRINSQPAEDKTEFSVLGLRENFELLWGSVQLEKSTSPTVVDVDGELLVEVRNQNNLAVTANLNVHIYGGGVESLQVRMPKMAKLVPSQHSGYTVSVIEAVESDEKSEYGSQLLEIKFPAKITGNQIIRLIAAINPADMQTRQLIELAGFEVIGAVRQYGKLAISVLDDSFIDWKMGQGVKRISALPDALRKNMVQVGFEYFSQPFSLQLQVTPQEPHIQVRPTYLVYVSENRIELEARLAYSIRDAKADFLEVDLSDWVFDGIKPRTSSSDESLEQINYVNVNEIKTRNNSSPLIIPLSSAALGEFEIVIQAHQEIPAEENGFSVELPQPGAAALMPATLVVIPSENIELQPRLAESQGLSPEPLPSEFTLPASTQPPLYFRSQEGRLKNVFSSHIIVHDGLVNVKTTGELLLGQSNTSVEQQFSYEILYEKQKKLDVFIPDSIRLIEVELNGEIISSDLLQKSADVNSEGFAATSIPLNSLGMIGPCNLVFRFEFPYVKLRPEKRTAMTIPMIIPNESTVNVTERDLALTFSNDIQVELSQGTWAIEDLPVAIQSEDRQELWLTSAASAPFLYLEVELSKQIQKNHTTIEKIWIQSWRTASQSQDRAVYSFSTSRDRIQLSLPSGIILNDLVAIVDGREVFPVSSSAEVIELPLVSNSGRSSHLLELFYPYLTDETNRFSETIDFPQLMEADWSQKIIWQLIVPQDQCLLTYSPELTAEFSWHRGRFYWSRRSKLTQNELENWIGASRQLPLPENLNQYLFSSFGELKPFAYRTFHRRSVVFITSGLALGIGLLLIYIPAFRHPGLLFLLSLVVLVSILLWPELSILILQSVVLGIILVALSLVLSWFASRERMLRSSVHGSSAVGLGSGSTEIRHRSLEGGSSAATTASSPLSIHTSTPEAN